MVKNKHKEKIHVTLNRILSACKESNHAKISKMLTLPSHNEPFVVEAMDRCCSICINIFLWRINFDKDLVLGSKHLSPKRRNNLLLRIEFFAEDQEHINTLLEAFREARFETLKSIFCSNEFTVRNFAYQLALERELKEGKSDALLLFLQWEKEQLEEKFDMHKLILEKSRFGGLTSITEVDPHFHVVSKLSNFMLRFDLSGAEPQQKKIKLDEKVPFVSEIYEHLKLDESVMIKKWFENKFGTYKDCFISRDLESKLLQICHEALKSYYVYYLVNYPSLVDKFDIENEKNGQSLLEYVLSTPEVGISVEILRSFVKAKPSVVRWTNKKTGDSILHVYVKTRTDTPEIVRFMVEELGLDPLQENKAKENALQSFLNAKWSDDGISKSFENAKEILEYLEAKNPLNGAEFIKKFSIYAGFLMVYRATCDKSPDQQFFLQYAIEKFYGPEINKDYPLIERFKEYYGQDLYKTSTHYEVVAFLHSIFNENNFYTTTIRTKFEFGILRNSGPMSFINGRICDLIAKLYDESDENLKLFFEIIMKIERIYTKYSCVQKYAKILSCLPPYDENSKEGFKKMHIERMIRVFNELISERNNACDIIQNAIEEWYVENITKDILNFIYEDSEEEEEDEEVSLNKHKLMKKIIQSGLFAALYSFTCHWKFTLRDNNAFSIHHYEEMKIFLRKSELFFPGSLYPQKGDVFSLKHLCRLEIRQMLIKDGFRNIATYAEMIKSLGLPKKMENYIRYLPECCKNE